MAVDLFKHSASRGGAGISQNAAEALVLAGLAAQRSGNLPELLTQRPRIAAWVAKRFLSPIAGTAGDMLAADRVLVDCTSLLLEWAVIQLRPDRAGHLEAIDRLSWLERTSWRPMLAVASHYGMLAVPEFSERYRRRPDETVVDNLCGLWSIGPSTFYRYLDKGKRQVVELLFLQPLSGARRLSLRRYVDHALSARLVAGEAVRDDWHARQAVRAEEHRDYLSALWHASRGAGVDAFIRILTRFRVELARDEETDALIGLLDERALSERERFDLRMAQAAIWLARKSDDRAQAAFDQALKIASQVRDARMLGIVYGALGKFHEPRDTDKAQACLEDSAELLRSAEEHADAVQRNEIAGHHVATLQKLAWLYVLRNDPRSKAVLDRAEAARVTFALPDDTIALLELTWGEYWRRSGNVRMAIERMHRALNLFERLGDTRQVLSTYNNLSILYSEARDFPQAIGYARRVLALDAEVSVDAYLLASAHGNLGVAFYWLERYDEAIAAYEAGLAISLRADLRVQVNRAHYNLAEAHYKRFKAYGDAQDEAKGDLYAAEALKANPSEANPFHHDAVRSLKNELLGPSLVAVNERLIHEEFAVHADEFANVQALRSSLVLPGEPRERVRAHLAIANAYLAISTKEREAALELIRQHGLGNEFDSEIDALQMTFSRELTKEKVLQAQWKQKSYGVLTEERAQAVLRQVLDSGSINKSGYATLCQVGLATASKHLGTLAERGLLVQMGKGPSTRYVLPAQ